MLERLVQLREFINGLVQTGEKDYENLELSDNDWEKILNILEVFLKLRITTKKLQSEQLTPGLIFFLNIFKKKINMLIFL